MALSVKLYRVVGKGKGRRSVAIDVERRGRRAQGRGHGAVLNAVWVKYEFIGMDFKLKGKR